MFKHFVAVASVICFSAASLPSHGDQIKAGKAFTPAASTPRTPATINSTQSGSAGIPLELNFPSSVGDVKFRHQMHVTDLGIKCAECHHQINAKTITTPHPDYLKSSWINCKICHDGSGKNKPQVYSCSACHQVNPANIADETLSAKVVIHKQCWKCHQVATGKEASKSCEKCHSGKNTP